MQLIPVIDLVDGVVVRAIAGRRSEYRPIVTPLARSSAPLDIVQGFLTLHAFETVYIADLDAIERRGDNRPAIAALAHAFPHLRFWVDAGATDIANAHEANTAQNVDPVIGSENLTAPIAPESFRAAPGALLSLDFRGEAFLGPEQLHHAPELWPKRVIVMTLARVGAGLGPDLETLRRLKRVGGPTRRIYAAGGVRGREDIRALQRAGADGVLVASALHDGALTSRDIQDIAQ